MHISHEGGDIENPMNSIDYNKILMMSKTLEEAKDTPEEISIKFVKGTPTELNGLAMKPAALLKKLNEIGGEHAIGVIDLLENRLVGMKSRGIYETPGATILYEAHQNLERLTLDKLTFQFKETVAKKYAELVYDGIWFNKLRESLDAFVDETQQNVTGTVKVKLYKGNIILAGMASEYALFEECISSFGKSEFFNHHDAEGFINLFNLPFKINAMMEAKLKGK